MQKDRFNVMHRLEKICRYMFQYNNSFCEGKIKK